MKIGSFIMTAIRGYLYPKYTQPTPEVMLGSVTAILTAASAGSELRLASYIDCNVIIALRL
jgi:hypothetical protein